MISIKQLFIKFLKDNNAYEQFMFNFKKDEEYRMYHLIKFSSNEFFKNEPIQNYILHAFEWKNTSEGETFWGTMYHKWKKIYQQYHEKI